MLASCGHCKKPPPTWWLKTIHAYSPLGFPGGSVVNNLPASARDSGDVCSVPGSGRSPRGGNGNPLQYSCLENPMDRGAWWAIIHGVAKSRTRLSMHTSRSPLVLKGTSLESVLQANVKVGTWPRPLQGPSLLLQPLELHCLPSMACGFLQLRSQQCSVDF